MGLILGHDRTLRTLDGAIRAGRLAHGWIFSGPKGVGKFTAAQALASVLLDPSEQPPSLMEIDDHHPIHREIIAGTHADVHIIRKELARYSSNTALHSRKQRNIPVDVLREFMIGGRVGRTEQYFEPAVYRTPVRGVGKVFIIDEAELLDPVGQNAVLKTLEEPPAGTYIVLVTCRPERLLPTIHSRCQHAIFGPLNDTAMNAWFARANLEIDPAERAWLEANADGSPGLALLAAEYGFHTWDQRLKPMLDAIDAGRFPTELGETLAELINGFAEAWGKRHKNASKEAANKDGVGHVFRLLGTHARQRMAQAGGGRAESLKWVAVIQLLRDAEAQLDANVNLKQVLENLAAQWLRCVECASVQPA